MQSRPRSTPGHEINRTVSCPCQSHVNTTNNFSPWWRHCGNANGHFGIFDPPIAVPPIGGGFFPTTSSPPYVSTTIEAVPAPTVQPAPYPTNPPVEPEPEPEPTPSQYPQLPASTPDEAPVPQPSLTANVPPENPQPEPTIPKPPNPASPSIPTPGDAQPYSQNNIPPGPTTPQPIVTIGTHTLNAIPYATGINSPNGPAIIGQVTTLTDSNNNAYTISYGPSGLEIQNSGTKSFIPNPTAPPPPPQPQGLGTPIVIATIGTLTITATPGASTLLIASQTLTQNGPPITLPGTHNVATMGAGALIIQFPSGIASTYPLPIYSSPLPTSAPTAVAIPIPVSLSSLSNLSISLLPNGAVQIGTQTISLGGPAATVQGGTVVTLAPAGLIVQQPHGVENTITLPGIVGAVTTTDAGNGIGGIIASVGGIAGPGTTTSSSATLSTSVNEGQGGEGGAVGGAIASSEFFLSPFLHTAFSCLWKRDGPGNKMLIAKQ
jgi:hypothetical protein